jgi:hypothetical protein
MMSTQNNWKLLDEVLEIMQLHHYSIHEGDPYLITAFPEIFLRPAWTAFVLGCLKRLKQGERKP